MKNRMMTIIAMTLMLMIGAGAGYLVSQKLTANSAPAASAAVSDQKSREAKATGPVWRCPMHPWIVKNAKDKCPICGMDLTEVKDGGEKQGHDDHDHGAGAVHISSDMVQRMGVKTYHAVRGDFLHEVRASARIIWNDERIVTLVSRVMGYAEEVKPLQPGQKIKKGELLLRYYSPDINTAQNELLQLLSASDSSTREELLISLRTAQGAVESRLKNWGVPEGVIHELKKTRKAQRLIPLYSDHDGILVTKNISAGQNMMSGMELFRLNRADEFWVEGYLYPNDLETVKYGMAAEAVFFAGKETRIKGTVDFIAPASGSPGGAVPVRMRVSNRNFNLLPGLNGILHLQDTRSGVITVPEQSVIYSGVRTLVILDKGDGYFEPREIEAGRTYKGVTEVLNGLEEGETVVTSAQFLIDSESSLKAALGQMQSTAVHQH